MHERLDRERRTDVQREGESGGEWNEAEARAVRGAGNVLGHAVGHPGL